MITHNHSNLPDEAEALPGVRGIIHPRSIKVDRTGNAIANVELAGPRNRQRTGVDEQVRVSHAVVEFDVIIQRRD